MAGDAQVVSESEADGLGAEDEDPLKASEEI
eukprot:CAMPEP_0201567516 /NCGR_PEP_ID=MMETSP0190_2-20130828/8022_1 /ASSEMBLY_ACC=CAM_ASM_000263 /TAXON_ID=37353 /ORGANISM="Rosalina sp." /LENGTH=30 /DNA_ID= /DNA_START= /DNA_END= /DNA_ORIENTATION=